MEIRNINQGMQTVTDNKDRISPAMSVRQLGDMKNFEEFTEVELKGAVDKLNDFLHNSDTRAEFEFHEKFSRDVIIKIVDEKTGKVIQEVPPKKILDMVARMCEMLGVLFDKKA